MDLVTLYCWHYSSLVAKQELQTVILHALALDYQSSERQNAVSCMTKLRDQISVEVLA
jgi:hypothetical protein